MTTVTTLPKAPMPTRVGFAFAILDRAITDSLGSHQFGKHEMAQVLAFFNADPPECALCGGTTVERWDHLIPVAQGGEAVLGNMVLACGKCDDSRGQKPYAAWMQSTAPGSPTTRGVPDVPQRMQRIQEYQATFGYHVRSLGTRLTSDEQSRLEEIRSKASDLRNELSRLIVGYQARTGTPQIEAPAWGRETPDQAT